MNVRVNKSRNNRLTFNIYDFCFISYVPENLLIRADIKDLSVPDCYGLSLRISRVQCDNLCVYEDQGLTAHEYRCVDTCLIFFQENEDLNEDLIKP